MELPSNYRVYHNHHLDSRRWSVFEPRDTDVVISTAYKAGTTWTQDIFYQLIYGDMESPPDKSEVHVWPDADFMEVDLESLADRLNAFTTQRYIKTHLPLDGLPYYPEVRYIVVVRDARDVFMSFFNHFSRYTDEFYAILNDSSRLNGDPCPRCPEDPRDLWQPWITRGWFEWESEGYPFWSNLHHTQSYWDYRHLPNILFIHYADMLADLDAAVRKLARFAGIAADDGKVARVVEATTFANVKKAIGEAGADDPMSETFRGGMDGFYFSGTNGRWREVLTEADLLLYEDAKQRVLSPDCADYLEQGEASGAFAHDESSS